MKKIIVFFLIILFVPGCGRKQKDIFNFPEEKPVVRINKLSLPSVRGVSITKTAGGNKVSWRSVLGPESFLVASTEDNQPEKELLGYKVYRLVRSSIVPKKPVNKNLIAETEFLDTQILHEDFNDVPPYCYMVRAVFKISDQIVSGPASAIVCYFKD